MKHFFSYFLLLAAASAFSQTDSINVLEEVLLKSNKLKEFSTGQTLTQLSDSLLLQQKPLLPSVLNYNTPIYFKENGLGMVSSPSFRGTTASQTAVLWNGININSRFNGQTDFNTINAGSYNDITVRGGGGSVIYGTGAIGGTIHLNNDLNFENKFQNQLHLGYGSFDTYDARYRLTASTKKWSTQVSFSRNQSENDYDYLESTKKNLNGQFYNNSLNAVFGYKFNNRNSLKFYSETFEGERHFSLIRPTENRTKYQDVNLKNLLEWESSQKKYTSLARLAFLKEEYKYYDNIKRDNFTFGDANTLIGKYDFTYIFSAKTKLNAIISNEFTDGKGSSVARKERNISSAALLWKHQVNRKFAYELAARKEVVKTYKSPFLYSLGAGYSFTKYYKLKLNVSKNFRIPTYNDLYWDTGGNTDLKAEEAQQYEVGNEFTFGNFNINLIGYYNNIQDMIRWLPGSSGFFQPENIDEVKTYGGEFLLNWKKQFGKHQLQLNGTYAYTVSENQKTKKQLIYVPFHKANTSVYYAYKKAFIETQVLFNDEVFTRTDNDAEHNIPSYVLWNVGAGYRLGKENQFTLGGRIRNLLDTAYENVENRPMPGINYNFYLTLNF